MNSPPDAPGSTFAERCPECGAEIAQTLLACPSCHWLRFAPRLKELSRQASEAEATGATDDAIRIWQETLALLPEEAKQHATVAARINALRARKDEAIPKIAPPPARKSGGGFWAGVLGTGALLLWKFKAVAIILLSKFKLLLLGLSKASTLFSMFAAFGVYWSLYGWRFAAGLVGSIYIHEMGHVFELRRLGVPASAPLFIPGLGAMIRLKQHFTNPHDDARVGLAGPIWGTAAALASFGVGYALQSGVWLAIGHVGAFINLFNLVPVWQLDGGRAYNAMNLTQRWLGLAAIIAAFVIGHEGLLILLALGAGYRAFNFKQATSSDWNATIVYVILVAVLTAMTRLHAPELI